jgi:NDP-sugar pyrophosphorylase family protein
VTEDLAAVILAGGLGTRLATRLSGRPKPLVPVAGVPLLAYHLDHLLLGGVKDVLILVSHEREQIENYVVQFQTDDFRIQCIADVTPRGTAGAVLDASDGLSDSFFVIYGDTFLNVDLRRLAAFHSDHSPAAATIVVHPNDHPADSDLVSMNSDGLVTGFWPYPRMSKVLRNQVNAALYVIQKDSLCKYKDSSFGVDDFGRNLFPRMLQCGERLNAYPTFEYIKDCGTPDRIDSVEQDIESGRVERSLASFSAEVVLIDRDGTVNVPNGFISKPDDIEVYPRSAEAIRVLNHAGVRTAIVTNQPVIARGECTEAELELIHGCL